MVKIERSHPAFEAFRVLAVLAVAKANDSIKPVFQYLYKADEVTFVSSDSRRMAVADLSNYDDLLALETGFYELIKSTTKEIVINKIDVGGNFPDYIKVIPTEYTASILGAGMGNKKDIAGVYLGKTLYHIAQEGVMLNAQYVIDVLKELPGVLKIHITGNMSPVVFEWPSNGSPLVKYILMPIQQNDQEVG